MSAKPRKRKKKPARPRGPAPERLKLEGDWTENVRKLIRRPDERNRP